MRRVWIVAVASLFVTACGGASLSQVAARTQGQTVAVVSLSINDYGNSLQGWNDTSTSDLMYSRATEMLQMVEGKLSSRWQVIPAPQFVGNAAYQQLAGPPFEVAVPRVNGQVMPTLAQERGDLVHAALRPGQAQALARATGANLLVVVYAEWGVVTGGFVPTSKALSKNVLSIYDASGKRLFRARKDTRGSKTLGAFGHVVVDENSIDEWVGAFQDGIARILGG